MHTSLFHCTKNHRILYDLSGITNSVNLIPLFRIGFGPSSFHKVDENSSFCRKEVEWEDHNLSGHLDNGRVQGRLIDTIIASVPQGSIFGPILFNIFFNDFFFFIPKASVHNFVDGNTLHSFAKTLRQLVTILQSECETAINWLYTIKWL